MADLKYEKELYDLGYEFIAGTDEAGRGPLAGPLVVAAVVLPKGYINNEINDSKKLSDLKRRKLYDVIIRDAIDYIVEIIEVDEVDKLNVYQASKIGMLRCINRLKRVDAVLSDAMPLKELSVPFNALIKGDSLSTSIAAASILAKVTRDNIMLELDSKYPNYDLKNNKGYGTKKHMLALDVHGVTPIHRMSFEPVFLASREKLKIF